MEIIDEAFGNMTFDYGWTKKDKLNIFNKTYEISCIASAYTGKGIDDIQREMYTNYRNDSTDTLEKVESAIIDHVKNNGIKYNDGIENHLRPTEFVFQKNGKAGIIFECDWDVESGLVVLIYPEITIDIPDNFL